MKMKIKVHFRIHHRAREAIIITILSRWVSLQVVDSIASVISYWRVNWHTIINSIELSMNLEKYKNPWIPDLPDLNIQDNRVRDQTPQETCQCPCRCKPPIKATRKFHQYQELYNIELWQDREGIKIFSYKSLISYISIYAYKTKND